MTSLYKDWTHNVMSKIILVFVALLFLSGITSVSAQQFTQEPGGYIRTSKPIICGPSKLLIPEIHKQAGETDVEFLGLHNSPVPGVQMAYTLHRNKVIGTWTFVESSSTGNSCILAVGKFEPTPEGPNL